MNKISSLRRLAVALYVAVLTFIAADARCDWSLQQILPSGLVAYSTATNAVVQYVHEVNAALLNPNQAVRDRAIADALKRLLESLRSINDPRIRVSVLIDALEALRLSDARIKDYLKLALLCSSAGDKPTLDNLVLWLNQNPGSSTAAFLRQPLVLEMPLVTLPVTKWTDEQVAELLRLALSDTPAAQLARNLLFSIPPANPAKFWERLWAAARVRPVLGLSWIHLVQDFSDLPFPFSFLLSPDNLPWAEAPNRANIEELYTLLASIDESTLTPDEQVLRLLIILRIVNRYTNFGSALRWRTFSSLTVLLTELSRDPRNADFVRKALRALARFAPNQLKLFQALLSDITANLTLDIRTWRAVLAAFDVVMPGGQIPLEPGFIERLAAMPDLPSDVFGKLIRLLVLSGRKAKALELIRARIAAAGELGPIEQRKIAVYMTSVMAEIFAAIQNSLSDSEIDELQLITTQFGPQGRAEWSVLLQFLIEMLVQNPEAISYMRPMPFLIHGLLSYYLPNFAPAAQSTIGYGLVPNLLNPGTEDLTIATSLLQSISQALVTSQGPAREALLELARTLAMRLLLQGVENAEDLDQILIGLQTAIGIFIANGMEGPLEEIERWLQTTLTFTDLGEEPAVRARISALLTRIREALGKVAPPPHEPRIPNDALLPAEIVRPAIHSDLVTGIGDF